MRFRLPAMLLLLPMLVIPMAQGGSSLQPELSDPAGDVVVADYIGLPAPGVPTPEQVAGAIDLVALWYTDDGDGLHAHVQVASLAALEVGQAGMPDFMWIAIFSPGYRDKSGPAEREGTWELRAEFRPLDANPWHFWLERPCKDGSDADGCAGEDRDILNGLAGIVDIEASTITITAPWPLLADPQPGDGIEGLWASAQVDWPAYPARSVDWDTDEGTQCYRFTALPLAGEPPAGQDGPTGSSNGRTGLPQPYQPSGCTFADVAANETIAATPAAAAAGNATTESTGPLDEPDEAKDVPSPGLAVLVVVALALARQRRNRGQ